VIKRALITFCAAALLVISGGCGRSDGPVPVRVKSSGDRLMGGGSSFIYPIMNRWAYDYYKATGVEVNYQSLGSSGGIKQFTVGTLAFGATDSPMNAEQMKAANGDALHIPVVMGAVAITYNLPQIKEPLKISGEVLADIYLGKITKWSDPALQQLNPDVNLPDNDIITVRRADGSGTTYIFADYLAHKSPEWHKIVGVGNSLSWPGHSIGAKGNEGVSAQVKRSANSLGYVELVYAIESEMPVAAVLSHDGQPVMPSSQSVTAAAAHLTSVTEDLCMSIADSPGVDAYPLAGLSWVVVHKNNPSKEEAAALKKFLSYILSDKAQAAAAKMNYARLPDKLLEPAMAKVNQIRATP